MKTETNLCMYSSTIILKLIFLTILSRFGEVISGSNPNGIPSHPPQSGTGYYRTENISVENWVDIGSLNDVTSKIGKLKTKIKINTGEMLTKKFLLQYVLLSVRPITNTMEESFVMLGKLKMEMFVK